MPEQRDGISRGRAIWIIVSFVVAVANLLAFVLLKERVFDYWPWSWVNSKLTQLLEWTVPYWPVQVNRLDRVSRLILGIVLIALFAYTLRRVVSRRDAARIGSSEQVAAIVPRIPPLRQWIPWAYGIMAIFLLLVPFVAQPVRVAAQPFEQSTIVGNNDTSDSMLAEDVKPTRGVSATREFRTFAADAPEETRIAWITFGGAPSLRVPPTTDRVFLNQQLDKVELGQKTALIGGIDLALDVCERIPLTDNGVRPCRIATLSDGAESVVLEYEREQRVDTLIARANALGVHIDTIGFGTDEPTLYKGEMVRLPPDKELLRQISAGTGGQFYEAANASQLSDAYEQIGSSFGYEYIALVAWEFFLVLAMICGLLAALAHLVFYNQVAHAPRPKSAEYPNLRNVA